MKLSRYALVLFDQALPAVEKWGYVTREGVDVRIESSMHSTDPTGSHEQQGFTFFAPAQFVGGAGTEILLHAEVSTGYEVVQSGQIKLEEKPRVAAESALSEMAAILGVLSELPWNVVTPRPYICLSAETVEERRVLAMTKRVILPSLVPDSPFHGAGLGRPIALAAVLEDRPDGLLLLAAATRAGQGVAKLHELMRVLENGFARAGRSLIDPLTEFLQSYPEWDLEYTREEVRFWIDDLRNPATHADLARSKRILFDSDVQRYLVRLEQAAYDVLFNKRRWRAGDAKREMRWAFSAAVLQNGKTLVAAGALMRTASRLDHFETFPLREDYRIEVKDAQADDLWADWYFSEQDWEQFDGSR